MGDDNMEKITLTIFTPTFNRAKELIRCYESLKKQNYNDFEWLIIDDGSTDETRTVVNSFINEQKIMIRYVHQSNQGKQAAWNHAISLAKGEFFCGLDSDDTLIGDALVTTMQEADSIKDVTHIIGVRCLAIRNSTQQPDGKELMRQTQENSWFKEWESPHLLGERIDILKTNIINQFHYPVSKKIKFIPEIWFYTTTASKGYHFLYSNNALSLFYDEAEENRLSKSNLYEHAEGHFISRSALLKTVPFICWMRNPAGLFKTIVRFSQVSAVKRKNFQEIRQGVGLYWALLLYPVIKLFKLWKKHEKDTVFCR